MKNIMKSLVVIFTYSCMTPVFASDDIGTRLINGKVTQSRIIVRLNGGMCSGTLVGPRSLITAAHCFKTGAVATFSVDGQSIRAQCYRNPEYSGWFGTKNDHALCYTDKEMKPPYAYIDTRPVKVGEIVQLTGYGCYNSKKQNDGRLRAGLAQVDSVNGREFTTTAKSGYPAALCSGDSGSGIFRYGDGYADIANQTGGYMYTSGIASRANMATFSILDILTSNSFKKFSEQYMKNTLTPLCGIVNCQ